MHYARDVALSHQLRANQARQRLERAMPLEDYGLQKTADSVSELGMYAMDTTKDKKLKKPLFVAPENIMIETGYGSHPEELKQVVLKSREAMSKKLVDNKGMSKGRADKLASQHIKATFDVGYANTWKKYFQGDDKEFKKWIMDKTKDLVKQGVMGHVHMSDNFGYEGEHGTLGQGNVPIKEFASELRKRGFKGTMIAEPAHNDYRALLGAWRALESPMYKIDSTSKTWTDVEHGYFGRTVSPNYITQTYLPMMGTKAGDPSSWSETPME